MITWAERENSAALKVDDFQGPRKKAGAEPPLINFSCTSQIEHSTYCIHIHYTYLHQIISHTETSDTHHARSHTVCICARHMHAKNNHIPHIYTTNSTIHVHTAYIYTRHTPYSHTYKTYNTCIHSTHTHTIVSFSDVNWVWLVSVVQQNRVPAL